MKLVVDLDETILDVHSFILNKVNKNQGVNVSEDDITSYDYYECLDERVADLIIDAWNTVDLYDRRMINYYSGAEEILQQFRYMGINVILATSPALAHVSVPSKIDWIKQNDHIYDDWCITEEKSILEPDVLIDDKPQLSPHYFQIIPEKPYNINLDHSLEGVSYIMVKNWDDVCDKILNLKEVIT